MKINRVNWQEFKLISFFLSLGLGIFFLSALLIILVRTKSSITITMPPLVGKNYVMVHNELNRLQLKVILEVVNIPEKNDGEILSQSVPPGKILDVNSHVYLTVNQGYDRVEIPNLKGQSLERAKEILKNVLAGDYYVSLKIGGITYVEREGNELPETVIDQIPEPGKITNSSERIYLLVTKPSQDATLKILDNKLEFEYHKKPLPFVANALNRKKIPWTIKGTDKTFYREEAGLVNKIQLKSNQYELTVYQPVQKNKLKSQYEFINWKIPKEGVYQVQLIHNENYSEIYIPPKNFNSGDALNMVLYRSGKIEVILKDIQDKIIKSKIIEGGV